MNLFFQIYRILFEKGSYQKRLFLHLGIFGIYSVFFILHYFYLEGQELSDNEKHYNQLKSSKYLVITMVAHLVFVIGVRWKGFLKFFRDFFSEPGSAFNLAVFRAMFFFILGGHLIFYSNQTLISWSMLPYSSRAELPYMGWFIYSVPINKTLFMWNNIIAGIFCWLVCIGFRTRFFLILSLPFIFYSLGVPMFFGKISHYHIFLWIPLFLAFSPISDRLSVDAFVKRRKQKTLYQIPADHPKYLLAFKFLWLQLAIIYGFAGIIKLWDCGLAWALSDSMIYQMQWEWIEHYDKVPGFRIDHYPVLAKIGGIAVIYFELLYVFLIFKPKGRIWAFIGAFSLHKMAGYFMYIDFQNLRFIHRSYIPWDRICSFIITKLGIKKLNPMSPDTIHVGFSSMLSNKFLKATFCIGAFIVGINFLFSIAKIHSYPFSSYPTYSAIVKNELPVIRMDAYDSHEKKVDVKQIGNSNNFRWENIRPYELRIANMIEQKDTSNLQLKLDEYWALWKNANDGLDDVNKVEMYLEYTELAPEKRNVILRSNYVGTVYPKKLTK